MRNRIVIIGCGGHARSVLDVIIHNNPNADVIFLDENATENEKILDYPVVKNYEITDEQVIVAIGDNEKRLELCQKYYDNLVSVISARAYTGKGVKIGKGVFIAHNAHVGILCKIGDFAIINTCASVDHECKIGKNTFIGPNATICGKVTINDHVFIGAGVTIIPDIKIAGKTSIGAGSVVVKDIEEEQSGLYIGIPATKYTASKGEF